ncbi:PEP-CTERM sorting domain-containing protein [Nostoc edaphicum CCNP1411]|uniref:PEP-CTERM sorting domain-containing protein n=1 Tax=Nostoc edaphicum CCNP1411 TaxID=1472755 RepID=A0A7D7QEX5_9NOSO|nr:PEP-CTERM sorting domain-containing protein [Nostoc edaphicum]QMS90859.1 PEP-CTERM sorting domain-containing protein [Nostoc edaphicum CCNP1411]
MTISTVMKKLSLATAGVTCLTLATLGSGKAQAVDTVIDFDSLLDLEIVDNQFLNQGVDFNGTASILQLGSSLNSLFPPVSANNLIYDNPSLGNGIIRVDAVNSLWSSVGGFVTGTTNVTLTAYASDNSILGTVSTGGANFQDAATGLLPNIFLSLTAPDISYITFQDSGNTYTVDNFTFSSQSVPEPTSMLGFFALAAFSATSFVKRKQPQNAATKA